MYHPAEINAFPNLIPIDGVADAPQTILESLPEPSELIVTQTGTYRSNSFVIGNAMLGPR